MHFSGFLKFHIKRIALTCGTQTSPKHNLINNNLIALNIEIFKIHLLAFII